MIKPVRHLDTELSVVRVSSEIIKILRVNPAIKYDELLSRLKQIVGEKVRFVYISSLGFLFLLGLIEYDEENDAFIFFGNFGELK